LFLAGTACAQIRPRFRSAGFDGYALDIFLVFCPGSGIIGNVFTDFPQRFFVSNYVVIKRALPFEFMAIVRYFIDFPEPFVFIFGAGGDVIVI
jgi:hypothetical protein